MLLLRCCQCVVVCLICFYYLLIMLVGFSFLLLLFCFVKRHVTFRRSVSFCTEAHMESEKITKHMPGEGKIQKGPKRPSGGEKRQKRTCGVRKSQTGHLNNEKVQSKRTECDKKRTVFDSSLPGLKTKVSGPRSAEQEFFRGLVRCFTLHHSVVVTICSPSCNHRAHGHNREVFTCWLFCGIASLGTNRLNLLVPTLEKDIH